MSRLPYWAALFFGFGVICDSAFGQQPGGLNVSATMGSTTPYWSLVGEETNTPVSGTISNPPAFVFGPTFTWSIPTILYSSNPPPNAPAAGGYYAYFDDPNAAQTTFKATLYTAGYWHFDLRLDVYGLINGYPPVPVGGTAFCAAEPVAAKELVIKRQKDGGKGYDPIGVNNKDFLPGEFVDLKVEDPNGGALANIQWTVPATIFRDYQTSNDEGKVVDVPANDLKLQAVNWCWADTGDKAVSVQATVGGMPGKAKTTLSVKKLDTSLAATKFGNVFIVLREPPITKEKESHLTFIKDQEQSGPGLELTGKVKVPAGFAEGSWAYLQLVGSTATAKITIDGKQKTLFYDTKGKVLDLPLPYTSVDAPDKTELPTGNIAYRMLDTPGIVIQAGALFSDSVERSDDFSAYIMFKPAGANSKYVSLKRFDWKWKGKATLQADKSYKLSGEKAEKTDPVDDEVHPKWKKNISNFPLEEKK